MAFATGADMNDDVIHSFQSSLSGTVLRPDDEGYAAACALWNGMIDKHPALIARCATSQDVVSAVNFAREQGMQLSVRGGGHSAAGTALVDDGLVVDLSQMRSVQVDADRRIAYAQGGATWADFDKATHAHGLATTGGAISTTGVAGLTLGGGLGWLMRSFGMTCDNLIGAEVVTASGDVIRASESENADLLWGLRGGGGNFGVVTNFEFRLHPLDTVLGGMIAHPFERAREALEFYREFNRDAPDELAVFCPMMTTPDGVKVVAFVVCYAGDPEKGQDVIKPLLEWGPPVMAEVGPMPYPQMQQMLDEAFPPGLQVYWRGDFIRSLHDEVIDKMIEHFRNVPSPLSALLLERFGGQVSRIPEESSAFVHRHADYNLAIISRWADPSEADQNIAWARAIHDDIRPYSTGVYVNYLGEEGEDRIKAAYGPDVYARLAQLKAKYDPENLFRANHNIQPVR
jgi:FAD/FMN-containing dehydrogenase